VLDGDHERENQKAGGKEWFETSVESLETIAEVVVLMFTDD
jgi:hypothetical protein